MQLRRYVTQARPFKTLGMRFLRVTIGLGACRGLWVSLTVQVYQMHYVRA